MDAGLWFGPQELVHFALVNGRWVPWWVNNKVYWQLERYFYLDHYNNNIVQ